MALKRTWRLPHDITGIDTGYLRPQLAASYLLVESGRGAFVETGTTFAADALFAQLELHNLDPGDVDYVVVTHVHLDHAGGSGALMQRLPNAKLVVHPRGARHLVDPTKLIAGATAVYGPEQFAKIYGEIIPVPAERVVEAPDNFEVEFGGRILHFLDTPGHARHHFSVYDARSRGCFTGDAFGISYREFDSTNGAFVFPTTTPVQFDPDAMLSSIDRVAGLQPEALYLTHFGRVTEVERLADDLRELTVDSMALAERLADQDNRYDYMVATLMDMLLERLLAHGCTQTVDACKALLDLDVKLNVQGLEHWLETR